MVVHHLQRQDTLVHPLPLCLAHAVSAIVCFQSPPCGPPAPLASSFCRWRPPRRTADDLLRLRQSSQAFNQWRDSAGRWGRGMLVISSETLGKSNNLVGLFECRCFVNIFRCSMFSLHPRRRSRWKMMEDTWRYCTSGDRLASLKLKSTMFQTPQAKSSFFNALYIFLMTLYCVHSQFFFEYLWVYEWIYNQEYIIFDSIISFFLVPYF